MDQPTLDAFITQMDRSWRWLIGLGCIPAALALYVRFTIPESPRFTAEVMHDKTQANHDAKISQIPAHSALMLQGPQQTLPKGVTDPPPNPEKALKTRNEGRPADTSTHFEPMKQAPARASNNPQPATKTPFFCDLASFFSKSEQLKLLFGVAFCWFALDVRQLRDCDRKLTIYRSPFTVST